MSTLVTIFVRHSEGCKYAGDEFSKRCTCRKHIRWSVDGKQYRKQAGTRSWSEAEQVKRDTEDQLSGHETVKPEAPRMIHASVEAFLLDKGVQGVGRNCLAMYKRDLGKLSEYCIGEGVLTVRGLTRELLAGFIASWGVDPSTSQTRNSRRARVGSFLRFAFESGWVDRVPSMPRIQIDVAPTMPLTADEYARVLQAATAPKVHALIQLMRYSGLAVRDAATLKRAAIIQGKGLYRVVTARQKTGTDVSVPIPAAIAAEVLAVQTNDRFIFWHGKGDGANFAMTYGADIADVFEAAGIPDVCHMKSHRLRDTFAVDLLEKGVPLEEVSKLLGHTSIRTTEKHYAKWVKGRQDRLDSLVTATWAA